MDRLDAVNAAGLLVDAVAARPGTAAGTGDLAGRLRTEFDVHLLVQPSPSH